MKKLFIAMVAAVGGFFAFGDGATSTPVSWKAKPLTADPSSIVSDGTLVYAYARDNYSVNGVDFAKIQAADIQDNKIDNDNLYWNVSTEWVSSSGDISGVADGDYLNLLKNCWWVNNWEFLITLRNLTPGKSYLVQIIGCRTSNNDAEIHVPEANDDSVFFKAGGEGWTYGGTLVGLFTAAGTERTVTLKFNQGADHSAFNAI